MRTTLAVVAVVAVAVPLLAAAPAAGQYRDDCPPDLGEGDLLVVTRIGQLLGKVGSRTWHPEVRQQDLVRMCSVMNIRQAHPTHGGGSALLLDGGDDIGFWLLVVEETPAEICAALPRCHDATDIRP